MTEQSRSDMKAACHLTAEWVLRSPSVSNRGKWLKKQIATLLSNPETIEYYTKRYSKEYRYADVQSAFLADILKSYDEEVN
jgi:hypothetical protein